MIYLDNCATTPMDPAVLEAMFPYFCVEYGNAASKGHIMGRAADLAVQIARSQVADLLMVDPDEIIFTSGATESVNLAIKGVMDAYKIKGRHLITMKTEHKAVLDSCESLKRLGYEISFANLDAEGIIDLKHFESLIRKDTVMASVMWVNNETGVIQPMDELGRICADKGVILFSDATQAYGKLELNPKASGVHLLAFSGHKIYGPKGIGGLYVCRKAPRIKLTAQMDGGAHEKGFRSGTLNVPGIVGLGKASALASERMKEDFIRMKSYTDFFETKLLENVEVCTINGGGGNRLPGICNIRFGLIKAEQALSSFGSKIAAATGSACSSASLEPSHVLTSYGLKVSEAKSSMRFSFGRFNTQQELLESLEIVRSTITKLRNESPLWKMYQDGIDIGELIV